MTEEKKIIAKDLLILEEQITKESIAAKKYEAMIKEVTDPLIKNEFENLSRKHKNNFTVLVNYLNSIS